MLVFVYIISHYLLYTGPVQSRRPFSDKVFKIGEPNLLVIPPGE